MGGPADDNHPPLGAHFFCRSSTMHTYLLMHPSELHIVPDGDSEKTIISETYLRKLTSLFSSGSSGVSAVRWDARGPLHRLKTVFRRTTCELGYQFWFIGTASYGPVVQNSQENNSPCESGVLVV